VEQLNAVCKDADKIACGAVSIDINLVLARVKFMELAITRMLFETGPLAGRKVMKPILLRFMLTYDALLFAASLFAASLAERFYPRLVLAIRMSGLYAIPNAEELANAMSKKVGVLANKFGALILEHENMTSMVDAKSQPDYRLRLNALEAKRVAAHIQYARHVAPNRLLEILLDGVSNKREKKRRVAIFFLEKDRLAKDVEREIKKAIVEKMEICERIGEEAVGRKMSHAARKELKKIDIKVKTLPHDLAARCLDRIEKIYGGVSVALRSSR
jgi:hypothetical protein